jgi:putative CocE/NonD family hydrolase
MMIQYQRASSVVVGAALAIMAVSCHSSGRSPASTSLPQAYTFPSCDVDPDGRYGARPARSFYVPMRDGVRIAVDVVLPERLPEGTRFPTILTMTRYWRAEEGREPGASGSGLDTVRFWASHAFAVVVGDVRGTGASFGVWPHHRSRDETRDFGEIMDWIVKQPWSDGQVAGFGTSYSANTGDWLPERNHAALKAVISRSPDYDPYADLYFPGGVPNAYMSRTWGLRVKDMDLNVKRNYKEGLRGVKPVDGDEGSRLLATAIEGRRNVPSVWEALAGITYRDDRPPQWGGWSMDDWGIHSRREAVERSGVPIQSWGSWMDAGTANGVLHRFMTLANPQHVFIGAWSHGGGHDASPYRPQDAEPNPPYRSQLLEDLCFLERHIRGRTANSVSNDRLLVYFTMGEEQWKTTSTWPVRGSEPQRWYFANGGRLRRDAPHAVDDADRYAVDFQATTGTRNRWATNNTGDDVVYGDRSAADRRLLTYTSEPLGGEVEITGQPIVTLNVTSTHTDGAFAVYLEEVGPDGYVRYLTEGQLRAAHRKVSADEPPYRVVGPYHSFKRKDSSPLVPGEITEITFELMPVSVVVRGGHRLRVAIAGADADTFQRIPEVGAPIIMVYRSAAHPSHIVLPITGGASPP